MIDSILIEQEAAKLGITVQDEEVTGTVKNILSQKNLTLDDFEKILEKEGMSLDAYKKEVKEQMTRSRVIRRELRSAIAVSDEEIGEYYTKHRAEYEGQTAVRLRQIVLFFPDNADEGMKGKIKTDMEAILKRLKSGEPFEKLASQFSQAPTARDGGDIGFVERGVMNPDMEQIAFSMEPGQISGIIESTTGLSIITVTEKRGDGTRGFESVRDEIKDRIMDAKMEKKYDEWMGDLRKKAHITLKN
jgi:parvulin-like peptidyl-prolyl isomerase